MRRREFITTGLAVIAAARPLKVEARTIPLLGFLNSASPDAFAAYLVAFHQGLDDEGYVEGRNLAIEYRWAQGQYGRLPQLAAELIARRPTLIVATGGSTTAEAVKALTSTVPVVFLTGGDPVSLGLVKSHARPGGNLTGVTLMTAQLEPKRIELLRELVPTSRTIGALVNPTNIIAEDQVRLLQQAAKAAGQRLVIQTASTEEDFSAAFAALVRQRADSLVVASDPFFNTRRDKLVALAQRHRLPTSYEFREFAAAGGLMSYGTNLAAAYRQVGIYAGRILAGAKPAELPVHEPTTVELVINMSTAAALGLSVPPSLLIRADEVIE